MQVTAGKPDDIETWMRLVKEIHWNFPGLETREKIEEHKETVLKFMKKDQALCVKKGIEIIGVLLFSRGHNMICCLGVSPEYRRCGVATKLLKAALRELDREKDISVSTFCEEDEKGTAPRALYKKFGFVEDKFSEEFGVPNQIFILHPEFCMPDNRMQYEVKNLRDHSELIQSAANWFHEKWGIPKTAYTESMEECIKNDSAIPQWYVIMDKNLIIAGAGVIENDFHDRKDLTPNVCAVYVEEAYRSQGIAGELLRFVCDDMKKKGMNTLYLVTDHTSFYERYGWEFLCMVQGDGEPEMTRMYVHKM